MTQPGIEQTRIWAAELHKGQTDKAGEPYMGHIDRVVGHLLEKFPDATEDEITAAYLHDALEDTKLTTDDMRARGYNENVIEMIKIVTKDPTSKLTYAQRIEKIAQSGNRGAIRIKVADNSDNRDPARLAKLPRDMQSLFKQRYGRSEKRLMKALASLAAAASDQPANDRVPRHQLPAQQYQMRKP